jgi:hypothetical protein
MEEVILTSSAREVAQRNIYSAAHQMNIVSSTTSAQDKGNERCRLVAKNVERL